MALRLLRPGGPAMWKSLWAFEAKISLFGRHCMVHNMPQSLPADQQRSFGDMMSSLPSVLPCSSCGDHLRQHLLDDPPGPHLAYRDDLERWLVRLHNTAACLLALGCLAALEVNLETGKAPVPEAEAVTGSAPDLPKRRWRTSARCAAARAMARWCRTCLPRWHPAVDCSHGPPCLQVRRA